MGLALVHWPDAGAGACRFCKMLCVCVDSVGVLHGGWGSEGVCHAECAAGGRCTRFSGDGYDGSKVRQTNTLSIGANVVCAVCFGERFHV